MKYDIIIVESVVDTEYQTVVLPKVCYCMGNESAWNTFEESILCYFDGFASNLKVISFCLGMQPFIFFTSSNFKVAFIEIADSRSTLVARRKCE